jgi:hypothetical protein
MLTPSECLLKAENYAVAARLADDEERIALLEMSALWRQRSFELQMLRFEHLKELADEYGPDPRGIAD